MKISGVKISGLNLEKTVKTVINHGDRHAGMKVFFCTLNDLMEAEKDDDFRKILNDGMATADGMPLVWWHRLHGVAAERVYGPDTMHLVLNRGREHNLVHYFIGDEQKKDLLPKKLVQLYPGVNIAGYMVLPWKNEFDDHDINMIVEDIKLTKADLVWVGVGARKQVILADKLFEKLPNRVYLTVGAAFDFLGGTKKQAPKWLRSIGGEWAFRLVTEPRRLTKRYLEISTYLLTKLFRLVVLNGFGHKSG